MTVRELMKVLLEFSPNAEVVHSAGEDPNANLRVTHAEVIPGAYGDMIRLASWSYWEK